MKKGWEIKKLGEICDFQNGFAFKSNTYKETGLPILRITNIQNQTLELNDLVYFDAKDYKENFDRFKVFKDDLVVAMSGATTGKLGINTTDTVFYLNQRVGKFIPKSQIAKPFLYYFLSTKVEESLRIAAGAAQPNLSTEQINNFEIPLPPLPEQQRIVAILDEAFAAIAKAKANAEQNLKNAKELFENYLKNVFENKGEGWEEKILKEVCELKSGTTISPSLERTEGDVLYTKVGDMNLPDNEVEINTSSRFVNIKEIKINQVIPIGAIIFPKRGGAIATNKKRKIIKPTIVDLNTMAIIPSKKIDKDYFFHWFQLFDLNSISNGANIPQINNYSFDEVYLPYPTSLKEQQTIVQKIDALSTETKKLEAIYQQKINDLEELKKS
ncbi:MAG: restriction endonuclease subunit S, partial [Chitinophagaceae bacterium]